MAAEEFRPLGGDEILTALTDQKVDYGNGSTQVFEGTMFYQYFADSPSAGRWAVREDRYCSLWPPSDLWACYDVHQNGDTIRFIDDVGGFTDGVFVK